MNIKTWSQRITPESTVVAQLRAMQAEINELRAENAAQRKVLERALAAMNKGYMSHHHEEYSATIAAIQGVLK